MNNNNQVTEDFADFTAPPPEVQEAARKEREKKQKERDKLNKALKPEQIRAAKDLADSFNAEKDAEEKSKLIQQLTDYLKLIKEYHPDRAQYLKVPKTYGPKNSCEELRVWIYDVKAELNKNGGLGTVKMLWVEGWKFFEKANENQRFGYNFNSIGRVAENSVSDRQMPDGSIICGPAVPTLAEFCVEHSSWFSTGVDMRLIMMAFEMAAGVHRMNTTMTAPRNPVNTAPSKESTDLMNEL